MAIATISSIKDKLDLCSLVESIQAYRIEEKNRNIRGINNFNSNITRRHSYANNTRRYTHRSYARDAHPYTVNDTPRAYANGDRRRANNNDTCPFPANDTPRVYASDVRDFNENIIITTPLWTT